ncbi:MAG: hypothetical protein KDA21_02175, partial [Phycisphaerales bacterium]|nr:hypothetical protein [Phycisphaerales bacterium]
MQWSPFLVAGAVFLSGAGLASAGPQGPVDRPTTDARLRDFIDRDPAAVRTPVEGVPQLLRPADVDTAGLRGMDAPWVTRARAVTVDTESFAAAMPGERRRLEFNLFDDVRFTGVLERLEERVFNSYTWFGSLDGIEGGQFVLVSHKGVLALNVFAPGIGSFQVRSIGADLHVVQEVDRGPIGCGIDMLAPPPADDGDGDDVGTRPRGGTRGETDAAPIIDIMIVWTEDAQAEAGTVVAMETQAIIAVDSVNLAFFNSDIDARMRLVFSSLLPGYFEAIPNSYGTELERLTFMNDGQLENVHTMRDEYGADLVAMFISHTANGIAGVAWVLPSLGAVDNDKWGFSVDHWALSSIPGFSVLAHELGHNFGCVHERENSSGPGIFPYSYGYETEVEEGMEDQAFHTIMAYDCADGADCQEAPHFSNPDVLFLGRPTGVAPGLIGQADCALTINNTAPILANYRASVEEVDEYEQKVSPITVTFDGALPNGNSRDPWISGDGRFLALLSEATNLVSPMTMVDGRQVYLLDRDADHDGRLDEADGVSLELFSINDEMGMYGDGDSGRPTVSADACRVAFESLATDLVPNDANGRQDIFMRVRVGSPPDPLCPLPLFFSGLTDRVSLSFDNSATPMVERDPDGSSHRPLVSRDGTFVVFESTARNLVDTDLDNVGDDQTTLRDIYLRELESAKTRRVSVGLERGPGNTVVQTDPDGASEWASVTDRIDSGFGKVMVAFQSRATNLLSPDGEDLGNTTQIYVREMSLVTSSSEIHRVSIFDDGTDFGVPANGHCFRPSISADGRFVAFESLATNLDPSIEDENATYDVFVHDRDVSGSGNFDQPGNRATYLVSRSNFGDQGNQISWDARLNADGSVVVFGSYASNLVPGDSNERFDIFRREWLPDGTGFTELVSRSMTGSVANDHSFSPSISDDGAQVAFYSLATDMFPDDLNESSDVFVYDGRTIYGDVDGDCAVGFSDLNDLLDNWGASVPPGRFGDLNGDGV